SATAWSASVTRSSGKLAVTRGRKRPVASSASSSASSRCLRSGRLAAKDRWSKPSTDTPLSRTRLSGTRAISPEANPTTTKREPHDSARIARSLYGIGHVIALHHARWTVPVTASRPHGLAPRHGASCHRREPPAVVRGRSEQHHLCFTAWKDPIGRPNHPGGLG